MKKNYQIFLAVFAVLVCAAAAIYYGLHLMSEEDKEINPADLGMEIHNGDIIFQTSTSTQSKAIQLATKSKYSHVGIIYSKDSAWYIYEAVQPVKITRLEKWIARGENQHYVIKRLKNSETVLSPGILNKMQETAERYKGKDYDLYFEWSDERIYCSELVWKIYKESAGIELGRLQKLNEFDLSSPEVKKKMKERYGDRIPEDELFISPAAIFDSDKLETIYEE